MVLSDVLALTVVREFFVYRKFHVLIFRVKNISDVVYLSEILLTLEI